MWWSYEMSCLFEDEHSSQVQLDIVCPFYLKIKEGFSIIITDIEVIDFCMLKYYTEYP